MIKKAVYPDSFNFDEPPVALIGQYSKGLDKQAMDKRASAFTADDLVFEKKAGYQYLHIITTGGMEKFSANRNHDAYNYDVLIHTAPMPKNASCKHMTLDGGLKKFHNEEYSKNAAVYKEHQTKKQNVEPSGYIVKAATNDKMCRGELIIGVDEKKWARELQKKANGGNLYFSIGCDVPYDLCLPKGTLIDTPRGWFPIEELQIGDKVRVAEGDMYSEVTATMDRLTEEITELSIYGIPHTFESTPNHPIKVVKADQIRACSGKAMFRGKEVRRRHRVIDGGVCTHCDKHVDIRPEWINAEDIEVGDYVAVSVTRTYDTGREGNRAFAYICGQYCGDGSLISRKSGHFRDGAHKIEGVTFSASGAGKDEDVLSKLTGHLESESSNKVTCKRDARGKNAYSVHTNDRCLAEKLQRFFGAGSAYKYISKEVNSWTYQEKLSFIGGLIDSDGCVDKNHLTIRICSVNRGLMLGVQRLCWSVGLSANLGVGNYTGSLGGYTTASTSYCLSLCRNLELLSGYSAKVDRLENIRHKGSGPTSLICDGIVLLEVVKTNTKHTVPTPVYNIEVDGYHTYCAEGLDVHNCNICHNKAHTREEYCDHAKNHLGKLTEDGDVVYVINDAPHFYDISGVATPADRTAFALKSLGGHNKKSSYGTPVLPSVFGIGKAAKVAAALKLSSMEKEIPAEVTDDIEEACCDEEAEGDLIKRLKHYSADEVIDALNRKGVMVSPKALYELLAEETDDPESIKEVTKDIKLDPEQVFFDIDDDQCPFCDELEDSSYDMEVIPNLGIMGMIEPFLQKLQLSPEGVRNRTIQITLVKKASEKQNRIKKEASEFLSRDYAKYTTAFVARNPDKALFALAKVRAYSK